LREYPTAKVFIIYDTKYGNTKLVAEQIAGGLREVEGIETNIGYVKEIDHKKLVDYDALVIGGTKPYGKTL
jgi:NAD(P)H dehydrogenase (quinone)